MIKILLGSRYSFYSTLQSLIQCYVVTVSCLWYGYHQRQNTGSRQFTEVRPCWTGFISGWVTRSLASDTAILKSLFFLNRNPLKHSKKIKDFLCNMFEFINLLWSLIFIKSIRCIVEVQQNQSWRTRREIGKSSTCEYNLRVNYSHFAPCKTSFYLLIIRSGL